MECSSNSVGLKFLIIIIKTIKNGVQIIFDSSADLKASRGPRRVRRPKWRTSPECTSYGCATSADPTCR